MSKRIVAVDFDGVIHLYSKGWQDGSIYDAIHPEFFPWALAVQEHFDIVIFSARGETPESLADMQEWMEDQYSRWQDKYPERKGKDLHLRFAEKKPKAWVYIDDRAIQFRGTFLSLGPGQLDAFRPWNSPDKAPPDHHPLVRPYVERAKQAEGRLQAAIATLKDIADALPATPCPGPCACSGACKDPRWHKIQELLVEMEKPYEHSFR